MRTHDRALGDNDSRLWLANEFQMWDSAIFEKVFIAFNIYLNNKRIKKLKVLFN